MQNQTIDNGEITIFSAGNAPVTLRESGVYQIYYQATLSNATLSGAGQAGIELSLNGVAVPASQRTVTLSSSTDSQTVGGMIMLNATTANSTLQLDNLFDNTSVSNAEIDIVYVG